MKHNEIVLDILRRSTIEGNVLILPPQQLDRDIYLEVNKTLSFIDAKWNRAKKGFVLSDINKYNLLIDKVDKGEKLVSDKKTYQYFPTPKAIAERLIDLAQLKPYHKVLEPSAGQGAIIDEILTVTPSENIEAVELNPLNVDILKGKYPEMIIKQMDFMDYDTSSNTFDRIIMNPPFKNKQGIDHITKAYSLLDDGGILVSVIEAGIDFRQDKKTKAFRDYLNQIDAYVEDVEAGEFKKSGTMIPTKILQIMK